MATTEQANEFLGGIAADVDDTMRIAAPTMTFALVLWMKGDPGNPVSCAMFGPPEWHGEQPIAFRTAAEAAAFQLMKDGEVHGLDNHEQVLFYEQDFYVLSNFSSFPVHWRNFCFPTVEHAYHWEKFSYGGCPAGAGVIEYRLRQQGLSAHDAFKLAQEKKHLRREDWDEVKVGIMRAILWAKVEQHEYVRRKLLATGHRTLIENSWRDDYWGWGPNRDGKNMLGKLWMAVRAELRGEPVTLLEP